MFKTAAALAFLDAWRVLTVKTQTPHFREGFKEFPTDLLTRMLVIEESPSGDYVIRFMGTHR